MASATLTKLTLLLVLVAMAEASSFWSTFENGKKGPPMSCPEKVSSEQIDACRSYVRGTPLLSILDKKETGFAPPDCCDQLRKVRAECRCDALRDLVMKLQGDESGYQGKGRTKEMIERAMKLPGTCGIYPSKCRFTMAWY